LVALTLSASLLAVVLGSIVPLIAPFLLYATQIHLIERRCEKRQMGFDRDYTALLMSLASGIKTGLDPLIALTQSAQLFQKTSIMCAELESINTALQEGLSEESAIARFGSRVRHPDVKLFRMAFALARKEGASLSYCLQRLARVTRQRQSFRRKTRGAVAMQKLSAFGIAGCTLLIGAIQGITNRGAFIEAFMHPYGRVLLILGLLLVGIGIIWMVKMAKIRV
jgi:tight adherence protein B